MIKQTGNALKYSALILITALITIPISSGSVEESENTFVEYDVTNGRVLGIFADPDFYSINILMESYRAGSITVSLPHDIIDARFDEENTDFVVLINTEEAEFYETDTTLTSRTLEIPFPARSVLIEIIGTESSSIKPISRVEIPAGKDSLGNFAVIFISNLADAEGCPEEDWKFAYDMGNLAWTYLAKYNIPTTLNVMCQNIDDYDAYHPDGFVTMYLLDIGQNIFDRGILYDREEIIVTVNDEEVPMFAAALSDKVNGERFYIRPYTLYSGGYYGLEKENIAWAISHEVSHIALHLLGHTEDIYSDWVRYEQQRCNLDQCEVERILVKNFVWDDAGDVYYDVMRHYKS